MKCLLSLVFLMGCLTGCSELGVIGGAAVHELQAEAINVEFASGGDLPAIHDKAPEKPIMVAKAEPRETVRKPVRKGAWERY